MLKKTVPYCLALLFLAAACATDKSKGNNVSLDANTVELKVTVESPTPQRVTPPPELNISPTLTKVLDPSEERNEQGVFFQIEVEDPTFSPTGWSYIDFDLMKAQRLDDIELNHKNESIDMGVYLQEDELGSLYFYYIPKNGAVILQLENPLKGELSSLIEVCHREEDKFNDLQTGYDYGMPVCLRTESNLIIFIQEGAETYKDDLYYDGPHRTLNGYMLSLEVD